MAVVAKGTISYFKQPVDATKQFIFENVTGVTNIENRISTLLADDTASMITVTITKKDDGQS